jgi:hypothetical protein
MIRQVLQHVRGGLHEVGALADQVVGTARAGVKRRARHREQLASGLLRQPCGDQAAGTERCFHHHHAERQAGDDAIAAGEMPCLGGSAQRCLADHGARFGDAALQVGMLGRVGHVETTRHRGHRMPGLQRAVVRRRIDATGEAGDHHQCMRKLGGEVLRHVLAVGRGVASADQGHSPSRKQRGIAQNRQDSRCIVQQGEQRRVVGLAREDQSRAKSLDGFQLAGCIGDGRD